MPPVAPPPVDEASEHPDMYVPEVVRTTFLPHFYMKFKEKVQEISLHTILPRPFIYSQNLGEILNIYETEFTKLSERYFTEFPWPEAELVKPIVEHGEVVSL